MLAGRCIIRIGWKIGASSVLEAPRLHWLTTVSRANKAISVTEEGKGGIVLVHYDRTYLYEFVLQ